MSVLSKLLKLLQPIRTTKQNLGKRLEKAFTEYLLATNIFSSVLLMQMGDWIQQEIEYQIGILPKRYDYGRMARMSTVGIGYGFLHHYFYTKLDKLWPTPNLICAVKKVIADQTTMSPVCIIYFFYCAGTLEGKYLSECTKELKEKFLDVYLVDCLVWPPAQFINFLFVPIKYQVIYINVITMFYDVYLSYIKHRQENQKEDEKYFNPYKWTMKKEIK